MGKVVVTNAPAAAASASGRVVVTGGTGFLGTLVAGWLACQQVGQVQLLGRTGRLPGDALGTMATQLSGSSAAITARQCDIACAADLEAVLAMDAERTGLLSAKAGPAGAH